VGEVRPILLCVDDEKTALYLRKLVLEQAGFEVLTATSAGDALAVLSTTRVDLVLSDILMPNVTGTELAHLIRRYHRGIPVVLFSGVNEVPTEAADADLFISKLEGPAILCQKIRALLEKIQIEGDKTD